MDFESAVMDARIEEMIERADEWKYHQWSFEKHICQAIDDVVASSYTTAALRLDYLVSLIDGASVEKSNVLLDMIYA
jgi:hypothetical protein